MARSTKKNEVEGESPADRQKRLIHKLVVLHFMVQLSITEDADGRLAAKSMGRVHHRIVYFAHYAPGITVSELLGVLGVKHQNIQAPLRYLIDNGFIVSRPSAEDGRVKQLSSTRKGDKLLEYVSSTQRDRVQGAFDSVSGKDIEGYFKVMEALLGEERLEWAHRLTLLDDPSPSV